MISILMSCYNSKPEYLSDQLLSIFNQTEQDYELLVYNDGGTEYVKFMPGLHYFDEGHKGIAKAYDFLLSKAKGEYVCFCDHDDIWLPDKLEVEKKYLDDHPDVDCVFGWLEWFGDKNKVETFSISDKEISKELIFSQPIKNPTVMFRKDSFGRFDAPFDLCADFWFYSQNRHCHYHLIEQVMVKYRRHAGEATKNKSVLRHNHALTIQRNLKNIGIDVIFEVCEQLDKFSPKFDPNIKQRVMRRINEMGK